MVKIYNLTAAALVEFESVYHRAWMSEVSKLDYGWFSCPDLIWWYSRWYTEPLFRLHHKIMLIFISYAFSLFCIITVLNITLLVRHPKTGKFVVNFDPKVTEVIREAKCLLKMGLEIPKQALCLVKLESRMNANHLRLQVNYFIIFFHRWMGYLNIK